MPKTYDFFATKFTEEYLFEQLKQNIEDVVRTDLEPLIRELLKENMLAECRRLNQDFLSLINFFMESNTEVFLNYPKRLDSLHKKFLRNHENLLRKNGLSLEMCEWTAGAWCMIMSELQQRAKEQKDGVMAHFLEELHHDMTVSFIRVYKYHFNRLGGTRKQ